MKLDWTNFEKGYLEELEKSAAMPVRRPAAVKPVPTHTRSPAPVAQPTQTTPPPKNIFGKVLGGAGVLGAGTGVYKGYTGAKEVYDKAENALSDLGGLLPLGLTALLGGGKGRAQGAASVAPNLAELFGQKKNILNYDTMDPRSLTAPAMGYGAPKVAEDITGLVAKSLQQRAVNSVIDRVLHKDESPASKPTQEHELELVSQHPQMKKLLEDEKNKAYLEKLLHE